MTDPGRSDLNDSFDEGWDFDAFCSFEIEDQQETIHWILNDGSYIDAIIESDEFASLAIVGNGERILFTPFTVGGIGIDRDERTVRAKFSFSTTPFVGPVEPFSKMVIEGNAVLRIDSNGECGLEDIHAEASSYETLARDEQVTPRIESNSTEEHVSGTSYSTWTTQSWDPKLEAFDAQSQSVAVYIDPGAADTETIRELFLALDAAYRANGGSGLQIVKHSTGHLVTEEVPV